MYMVAARLGCERATVGGPPLALTGWAGLKNPLSPCRGLVSGKEGCLGSERVYDNQ